MSCPECGTSLEGRRFCTECGLPNRTLLKVQAIEDAHETVLFEKTLYPWCIFSFLCCCPVWYRITSKRIDSGSGCCFGNLDSIDIRRVKDLEFDRNCGQLCINRGTITIHAADETHSKMKITCFGAKKLFTVLKHQWNESQLRTVVE